MLNWFRRKPDTIPARTHGAINTLLDYVWNSTALTWQNLFGTLNHERMYSNAADFALRLTAVKCAIDIYTGMVGSLPRRMYGLEAGTGAKQRIIATTDHPASRMFSHYFHPELLADDALNRIVYDVLMDGNCYFLRETDAQGRTARGYYIHPSRIPRANIWRSNGSDKLYNGRSAAAGELVYRIETGTSTRDENREAMLVSRMDMIHIKGKVPDTEHHRAHGFIEDSQTPLELYEASERFGHRFYSRGIATQMFLTTENRVAPEVLKRIETNFNEDPNAPLEDIFKTRVLEQGLKPVHMGIPFQHLQFIETRAFSVEDVARGLNVPPALLHSYMGTKAGDADLAQAISLFVQTGIGPFLARISSQLRSELLPLPSQMLYSFEFETLYLYRNVIDKFSTSLRNLFEIGILDRVESRALLGLHIDPSDAAANPRYVPVNLMTVEHSLHLEKGAALQNDMLEVQTEGQEKTNEGMVSAEEHAAAKDALATAKAKPPSGKMDKSPSKSNIDKRIRNKIRNLKAEAAQSKSLADAAFANVINGLRQYETRVLEQKKQTRPDDYDAAVTEFYATDGKFHNMLKEQLLPWAPALPTSPDTLITNWITSQKYPEG